MSLSIILLSLAGAVISSVVGTIWYSPGTPMGKVHMKFLGFDKLSAEEQKMKMEAAKPTMPKLYAAQFALSLLASFAVVFVVSLSVKNGVPLLMAIGFPVFSWLFFMVPINGSGILWSNCDCALAWKKFFSDILCNLVTILLIAGMTSLFV